jgi:signal transduction histidine kinase
VLTDFTLANRELKQLTYTTAHDLRSPVNNLIAAFGLIALDTIQDTEIVEYLEILNSTTHNLKETLNNYVDVLIQKNSSNLNLEHVSLTECLQETINSLKSLIFDSNTEIKFDFSEADWVSFNRSYLKSIFLNLITNSIKYAKPSTYPSICVKSYKEDGKTILVLSDNGIGFDLEKLKDKVFGFGQRFSNHNDSKGIGLYLVNNYLTSLGGKIDIESEPNCGARFIICFKD